MLMSNPAYQTDFSAKEPSLGYYYQIRYSLYLLLREKVKDNPSIRLEDLDDIVLNDIDGTNLYQTKVAIIGEIWKSRAKLLRNRLFEKIASVTG